jgi:hypothetical protein
VQTCETAYKHKKNRGIKIENKFIYQDKCYVIINILYAMYAQSECESFKIYTKGIAQCFEGVNDEEI